MAQERPAVTRSRPSSISRRRRLSSSAAVSAERSSSGDGTSATARQPITERPQDRGRPVADARRARPDPGTAATVVIGRSGSWRRRSDAEQLRLGGGELLVGQDALSLHVREALDLGDGIGRPGSGRCLLGGRLLGGGLLDLVLLGLVVLLPGRVGRALLTVLHPADDGGRGASDDGGPRRRAEQPTASGGAAGHRSSHHLGASSVLSRRPWRRGSR